MQQDTRWQTEKPAPARGWHGGAMLGVVAVVCGLIGMMLAAFLMPRAEGESFDWTVTLLAGVALAVVVWLVGASKQKRSAREGRG